MRHFIYRRSALEILADVVRCLFYVVYVRGMVKRTKRKKSSVTSSGNSGGSCVLCIVFCVYEGNGQTGIKDQKITCN